MELNLQPRALSCFVSGQPFGEGDRVVSLLTRLETGEVARFDSLEAHAPALAPRGFVACRWVQVYKPQQRQENMDRALKLTAETLFLALADPATEPTPENVRLVQFLALMLERKKLLRSRGLTADGARQRLEHLKSKGIYELPADELTPEFFRAVSQQLGVLVGEPVLQKLPG